MKTTIASNTELQQQQQQQQQQPGSQKMVSPHQEPHRLREAQDLLHRLQGLLVEGEAPSVDILSDALLKAEELIHQSAASTDMDEQTRKALEDITALIVSARQLGRNKDIADRLQKISIESEKALQTMRRPGVNVTGAAKEAGQDILEYMTNWRPLFYLIMSSTDFRQLILDTIRISKNVIKNYGEDIKDETSVSQKFVEGASVKEMVSDVKEKAKQKGRPQMNDDEWNLLQDDVQRVLVLLSKEPTYRDGIERIFNLLDMFQKHVTQDAPLVTGPENVHMRRVVTETEDLVACFSGRDTFEKFKFHLKILIIEVQKNEKLHSYLTELKQFILKAKSEEEIRSEEFKQQSKDLAYRGRDFTRELRELDPFLNSAENMLDNIKNDEFLQILRHHAGVVQSDLSYVDTEGKIQVDTDLLSKLQTALLPSLAEALKYIPVPKIQSKDSESEFWIDNIVLCSYDAIPENIKFHLEADSELSIRDIEVKSSHTFLVIQLNRIRTELKDLEFCYKKKSFPTFEEHGKVTLRIKGDGSRLRFTYMLEQGPQDAVPRIRKGYASFSISDLDIEFNTATLKHPVIVPMLTTIFKTQIRSKIEYQVESNLNGFMEKLGEMITSSLSEMNRPFLSGIEMAKKAIKTTPIAQVYEKRREIME
jgi:hypothetical protein